ncbi:MAG: hypothetical protein RL701_1992 [Pseudomonadota bacterium]
MRYEALMGSAAPYIEKRWEQRDLISIVDMKNMKITTLLIAGMVSGLGACTTAHMVVPAEVAKNSDVVLATERSSMSGSLVDESFKLGQLAITDVDRKWNSTSSSNVLGFTSDATEGGYAYKVKGPGVELSGGCATEKTKDSKSVGGGWSVTNSFSKLGCSCTGGGTAARVVVSAGDDGKYSDELTTHDKTYRVTAINEAEGMLSNGQPSGYRVDGESARGAVEVLKPGRVWFAKDVEEAERNELACVYVGLMLYLPPRER